MPICDKCLSKFPNYVIVDSKTRNLCKRRFCLDCSPFGKRNRRDLTRIQADNKICKTCQVLLPIDDFYVYKGGHKFNPNCKECMKKREAERQRELKKAAIEYKGGSCIRCGYSKFYGALEFHHRDKASKLFSISRRRGYSLSGEVLEELDKCDLLCSNCHREVENPVNSH